MLAELELRSKMGTKHLIEQIIHFSNDSINWYYDEKRSKIFSDNLGKSKGCAIILEGNEWSPGFAFCERKEGIIYLANIVPRKTGQIPHKEYNKLSKTFFEEFKKWSKGIKNKTKITISSTKPELENIISAKIPRKQFQLFLNHHPLSYHSLDIERLDLFTCSVSRYSRKPINLSDLGEYLMENKNWLRKDILWCIGRIEIGLEILKVYKKY